MSYKLFIGALGLGFNFPGSWHLALRLGFRRHARDEHLDRSSNNDRRKCLNHKVAQ